MNNHALIIKRPDGTTFRASIVVVDWQAPEYGVTFLSENVQLGDRELLDDAVKAEIDGLWADERQFRKDRGR